MIKESIQALLNSGMTEGEIAAAVGASQPTINRIKLGKQKNPGYELGTAIVALRNTRCPAQCAPSETQPEAA